MAFDLDALRDILVCPQSKAALVREGESLVSVDPESRLKYEIREGIPIMLVDEAVALTPEEWGEIMRRHGRDPVTGDLAADDANRSRG